MKRRKAAGHELGTGRWICLLARVVRGLEGATDPTKSFQAGHHRNGSGVIEETKTRGSRRSTDARGLGVQSSKSSSNNDTVEERSRAAAINVESTQ